MAKYTPFTDPDEATPENGYTKREMYLVDLNVKKDNSIGYQYLRIQFVPDEITVDPSANWNPIASVGRNNPFYHYTGGEDTVTFTLDWCATDRLRLNVITSCKWIEALMRSDGYKSEPHKIKLIWGDLFQDSEWIVASAPYRMVQFQAVGMRPIQAYQEITLKRVVGHNRSRLDIRSIFS